MTGLLAPQAEITIEIAEIESDGMISAEENAKTRTFLMENWNLGPEKTAQPNMDYWRKLSKVWRIAPEQAKRNLCANCEYFNDSPDMLDKMESPKPNDDFKRFLKMFADFAVSMQKVALNKPEVEIEVDAESIKKAIDQNTLAIRKNTEALQRQNEILMMDTVPSYDFEGKIAKLSKK